MTTLLVLLLVPSYGARQKQQHAHSIEQAQQSLKGIDDPKYKEEFRGEEGSGAADVGVRS